VKEETRKFLEKADRAIRAAEPLLDGGDAEFASGRAYYAMFYVAEALLNERGSRFQKHSAVHAAFGEHLVKTRQFDPKFHRWLLDAFDARLTTDYGIDSKIGETETREMVAQAREMLETARRVLGPVSESGT
jgi:uncharacterized protein (UPF0332 family)